jgi:hypothetical protein
LLEGRLKVNRPSPSELDSRTLKRVQVWRNESAVKGVVLVGSKAIGYSDERSDDDLYVYLDDLSFSQLNERDYVEVLIDPISRKVVYDAEYNTVGHLQLKAQSWRDEDHWLFERAAILFDADGTVTAGVNAAWRMPSSFRKARLAHGTLDAHIAMTRLEKTQARGFTAAAALLTARGARALARILFALEWRWVPLDHWLEPELMTLENSRNAANELLAALRSRDPRHIGLALDTLDDRLVSEGIPSKESRQRLLFDLLHPARAHERSIHGLS